MEREVSQVNDVVHCSSGFFEVGDSMAVFVGGETVKSMTAVCPHQMPKEDLTNIEMTSVHGDAVNHHPMDIVILHIRDLPSAMSETGRIMRCLGTNSLLSKPLFPWWYLEDITSRTPWSSTRLSDMSLDTLCGDGTQSQVRLRD